MEYALPRRVQEKKESSFNADSRFKHGWGSEYKEEKGITSMEWEDAWMRQTAELHKESQHEARTKFIQQREDTSRCDAGEDAPAQRRNEKPLCEGSSCIFCHKNI